MPMEFEILDDIRDIETIATGQGVYVRRRLNHIHGKGRWRKRKGVAIVRLDDRTVYDAWIYWFEAHGIRRRGFKIKKLLR